MLHLDNFNSLFTDDGNLQQGADGTGISPALSDDGFTKLDVSLKFLEHSLSLFILCFYE